MSISAYRELIDKFTPCFTGMNKYYFYIWPRERLEQHKLNCKNPIVGIPFRPEQVCKWMQFYRPNGD